MREPIGNLVEIPTGHVIRDTRPVWVKNLVPPTGWAAGEPVVAGCPACGAAMTFGSVECPNGRHGCCVCHYGYRCSGCGKQWQDTPNAPVNGSTPSAQVACSGGWRV